jgi:hypothetical protein
MVLSLVAVALVDRWDVETSNATFTRSALVSSWLSFSRVLLNGGHPLRFFGPLTGVGLALFLLADPNTIRGVGV